jgi:hypothetical protein
MGCFIVIGVIAVILFLAYLGNNPEAPISISFRPSLLDSSCQVLQVTNLSSTKTLTCRMEARNATRHENVSYSFSLPAGKTQEIGILECNWWFVSNESVTIYVEGYRSSSTHVP